jgi:hypothetical protein
VDNAIEGEVGTEVGQQETDAEERHIMAVALRSLV